MVLRERKTHVICDRLWGKRPRVGGGGWGRY